MNRNFIVLLLATFAVSFVLSRPPDGKEKKDRVLHDKPLSDSEHWDSDSEHNLNYDHEAFLGEDSKSYDELSPEESKERLK